MSIDSNVLFNTKFLQLKSTKSPDGKFDWYYAHRPNTKSAQSDAVVIAPVIHEESGDSILFIETRRPPMYAENKAETCIELPAGLIGDVRDGESVEEATKTELLEETGLKADKVKILMENSCSSGGCVSETVAYARADISDVTQVSKPVNDNGVIISSHKVPVEKVNDWLIEQSKNGKSVSAQAIAALYCAQAIGAK